MAQQNNLKIDNIHQIDPDWGLPMASRGTGRLRSRFYCRCARFGSHQLIEQALFAFGCSEHRGGWSADSRFW
jgi:glutamate synthase (ferredoxin)